MLEAKVTLSPKTAHKILSSCMVTGRCHHISYIRRQFHDITMIFLPVFLYNSFLFLTFAIMKLRTEEEYYIESKRLREETMRMADALKDNPMRFVVTNVITMDVEITKSDLKTIVSKNTQDNRFNAFKNKVAQDIRGFLEKSVYEGWREVIPGKHPETAFFAYFSRELGGKAYLCVR